MNRSDKSGRMLPVPAIVDLARSRGIDPIVDGAHAFGQVPRSLLDLGAPFVGVNLHKWVGAPIGVFALYIRQDSLDRIDRAHGDDGPPDRIDSRIHTGTTDFAAVMTVTDALDFQDRIGVPRKAGGRGLIEATTTGVEDSHAGSCGPSRQGANVFLDNDERLPL